MRVIAKSQRSVLDRLDDVRMTEQERQAAKAYMQQGEFVADLILGAAGMIRSVLQRVERGLRALTPTGGERHEVRR